MRGQGLPSQSSPPEALTRSRSAGRLQTSPTTLIGTRTRTVTTAEQAGGPAGGSRGLDPALERPGRNQADGGEGEDLEGAHQQRASTGGVWRASKRRG
jgi:hypothetical protein